MKWLILFFMLAGIFFSAKNLRLFESKESEFQIKLPICSLQKLNSDEKASCKELIGEANSHLLVHFWSTTCPSCVVELPKFLKTSRDLRERGIKTIFISMIDDRKSVMKFLKKNKIEIDGDPFFLDTNGDAKRFGTTKIPETYLYSSSGYLLKKFVGAKDWDPKFIEPFLKKK